MRPRVLWAGLAVVSSMQTALNAAWQVTGRGIVDRVVGLRWLLGAGTPSPLRKLWLKLQLARLDSEARREGKARRRRAAQSGLRVIEGGSSEPGDKRRGPDGKWLN